MVKDETTWDLELIVLIFERKAPQGRRPHRARSQGREGPRRRQCQKTDRATEPPARRPLGGAAHTFRPDSR